MRRHHRRAVGQGLIAAHEVAEDVTHKDLLDAFGVGQFANQFERSFHRAVHLRIAAALGVTGGVERDRGHHRVFDADALVVLNLRGRLAVEDQFIRAVATYVIKLLKGQAQRIHVLVALPAVVGAHDAHALAQRVMWLVRQRRVHRHGGFGDRAAQQLLIDPASAPDRVVLEVRRMGDQPARVREQAHTLISGHLGEALRNQSSVLIFTP